MVGFGLEGYEERIPCPHCESTDCCGILQDKRGRQYLVCIRTGKRVTTKMLEESAKKHGLTKVVVDAKLSSFSVG